MQGGLFLAAYVYGNLKSALASLQIYGPTFMCMAIFMEDFEEVWRRYK